MYFHLIKSYTRIKQKHTGRCPNHNQKSNLKAWKIKLNPWNPTGYINILKSSIPVLANI